MGGDADNHVGAFLAPARLGQCGDLEGGKTPSPTVSYVRRASVMAGPEWDASAHHTMKEGGGAKYTAPGSGGGEGDHLQGLHHIWKPPGYGDLL